MHRVRGLLNIAKIETKVVKFIKKIKNPWTKKLKKTKIKKKIKNKKIFEKKVKNSRKCTKK